jgi:hypothetical protein
MRLPTLTCSTSLPICLSVCLFVYVSVSVCVGGWVRHLLHELPVGYHDLGDALQRVGLDGRVFVADHAQCDILA